MQTPQQKALQLQAQYHEVKKQIDAEATPWVFGLREGYVDGVLRHILNVVSNSNT